MNKTELISEVAGKAGLSKVDATKAVEATFGAISKSLSKKDDVRVIGFGTFSAVKRAAKEGRNPQTGKKMTIPAATVPKFKAGKGLKQAVNK